MSVRAKRPYSPVSMTILPFNRALPRLRAAVALTALLPVLGGCHAVVLDPSGDVASQQADMVIIATVLMLLIIVPVMALTVMFARKYRASNTEAEYEPEWEHSTQLELVIWAAPLLIIIALGAVTWTGTHKLDPYHPIERLDASRPLPAGVTPLEVEVVALDWKWLFIYPQYGIATVNELAAPVDRPVHFRLTASRVMNDFYIPALAGQVYAMPSMETQLNAVINAPGTYEGFNANYSGEGFNYMKFPFHGLTDAQFDQWIGQAKASGRTLDRAAYLQLDKPSKAVPVIRYSGVAADLYQRAMNNCVAPGTTCLVDEMHKDMATAAGHDPEAHDASKMPMAMGMSHGEMQQHGAGPAHAGAHHTGGSMAMPGGTMAGTEPDEAASGPLRGAGLTPPGARPHHAMVAEADARPLTPSSL